MKIQTLAVIFVIIILPISILLSEFIQAQINTLNLQTSYDSKLLDSTYDAVVAFQKNTINSTSSDITSSKMRDIEASANTFLNSIANSFNLSGNAQNAMKSYIPAVVYTMYDGYYIYSPYKNELGNIEVSSDSTYQSYDDVPENTYGLKPYIYYSREYAYNGGNFVITYSLDNYITIQGKVNVVGEGLVQVNDSGYLIDPNAWNGSTYRGGAIMSDGVKEYIDENSTSAPYPYVKVNGIKYYLNEHGRVFSLVNNERVYLSEQSSEKFKIAHPFDTNNNAITYYNQAKAFTDKVLGNRPGQYNLGSLKSSHAKNWGDELAEMQASQTRTGDKIPGGQADYTIFANNAKDIEYSSSEFNQERTAVIRYAIEKNLQTAIANYNNFSDSTINFQMPNLQDDEWDTIINNISVISFLQGMNMGTKTYNGYAIVTNNKNLEAVSEDTIYITTTDGEYHRVTDTDLVSGELTLKQGFFNVDFERKSLLDENGVPKGYYYPQTESGCYSSIVNQSGTTVLEKTLTTEDGTEYKISKDIYEYLAESGKEGLASVYYTALGRERQGLYRVNNEVETYTSVP